MREPFRTPLSADSKAATISSMTTWPRLRQMSALWPEPSRDHLCGDRVGNCRCLTRALSASSSAPCRFDGGDVDLFHFHHRLERALGGFKESAPQHQVITDRADAPHFVVG